MTLNKKIIASVAVVVTVMAVFALVSCNTTVTFNKAIGFSEDDVNKIVMIDGRGVEKNLTAKKSELFALLGEKKLKKNSDKKYDYEWDTDYGYIVNFYVNGCDGYYSLVFNHGMRAADGYKNKRSKTGFYDFESKDELINELNDIFYL